MADKNMSVPLVGPFDAGTSRPNFNVNPNDADARPVALPTWDPSAEEEKTDVTLARIADAETNGEYGSQDGSHPCHDERTAGVLDSDALMSGGAIGGKCRFKL